MSRKTGFILLFAHYFVDKRFIPAKTSAFNPFHFFAAAHQRPPTGNCYGNLVATNTAAVFLAFCFHYHRMPPCELTGYCRVFDQMTAIL
jgi:hypothetical protein